MSAHLVRNIVNQVLEGAVECGAYALVDMKERQLFNDVADAFVTRLLAEHAKDFDTSGERVKNQPDSLHVSTYEGDHFVFTTDTALLTGAQPAKLYKLSGTPNHAVLAAHGTVDQMQEMAERLNANHEIRRHD